MLQIVLAEMALPLTTNFGQDGRDEQQHRFRPPGGSRPRGGRTLWRPGTVIEAFVAPRIGNTAMDDLASGGMGVVDAVFGVAFLGGSLCLGWALRKSGLRPVWLGTSLIVVSVVMLASMGTSGPVGGAVIIAATVVYGSALAALGRRS